MDTTSSVSISSDIKPFNINFEVMERELRTSTFYPFLTSVFLIILVDVWPPIEYKAAISTFIKSRILINLDLCYLSHPFDASLVTTPRKGDSNYAQSEITLSPTLKVCTSIHFFIILPIKSEPKKANGSESIPVLPAKFSDDSNLISEPETN